MNQSILPAATALTSSLLFSSLVLSRLRSCRLICQPLPVALPSLSLWIALLLLFCLSFKLPSRESALELFICCIISLPACCCRCIFYRRYRLSRSHAQSVRARFLSALVDTLTSLLRAPISRHTLFSLRHHSLPPVSVWWRCDAASSQLRVVFCKCTRCVLPHSECFVLCCRRPNPEQRQTLCRSPSAGPSRPHATNHTGGVNHSG
jgi:hypothetical protein